jgi:fimbrial chaperone protein
MRSLAAALLSELAATGTVAASTLNVAPVRVELNATQSTAVVTIHNSEDSPVVVQARPTAWSQRDERDQLDETHDVIVTPPLFTIPAKSDQVLRIALLRKPDPVRELDYRLVLSEVPPEVGPDFKGLRMALRITLPIFGAAQTRASPEVAWHHQWQPDGTLQIEATNSGTAHIQILDFDVQGGDPAAQVLHTDNARYLLPGSTARWQLHTAAGFPHTERIVLHGHSDAGDFKVTSDAGAR